MQKFFDFKYLVESRRRLIAAILAFGLVLSMVGSMSVSAAAQENSTSSPVAVALEQASVVAADPIKTCGPSPKDKDGSSWGKYFKVNGVNIRKSPSTNSTICAQGQKSHVVDYHCWTVGADGKTWTYLRDATTHYAGWVRDDLLVRNGSLVHC